MATVTRAPATTTTTEPVSTEGGSSDILARPRKALSPQASDGALSAKSNRSGPIPGRSPVALTGVAAMAELRKRKQQQPPETPSRETSPNPAVHAMRSLLGASGMSRPSDAPATDKLSEPLQKAAEKMHVNERDQEIRHTSGDAEQVSPVSAASFSMTDSLGVGSGLTAMATAGDASTSTHQGFVAEPADMHATGPHENGRAHLSVTANDDAHKAYSYPGPPPHMSHSGPSRGASLPGYGQSSPKSSSSKRHKCPYCDTDFTRHHNLKSHLLTHSQEKPYACLSCPARFRRQHDLKRHSKLHTGERPHTCDKCGRRFARGDALARHSKGPGGCAGRRSSFGGDDDYDQDGGDGMDGVEYTGDEEEGSSPDHGRHDSESNRKRSRIDAGYDSHRDVYRQHSSTYPPIYPPPQNRPSTGGMGPPAVVLPGASNPGTSPRDTSSYPSPAAAGSSLGSSYYGPGHNAVFPQSGAMTESPKPLSPGHPPDQHRLSVGDASMSSALNRHRSPSLTTQFQHAHFGRGSVGGRTPPIQHVAAPAPVLPPLGTGSGQASSRVALPSALSSVTGPPGPSLLHSQQTTAVAGPSSNPGSLSSHGQQSSGSSLREVLAGGGGGNAPEIGPNDLWSYVRTLDGRFSRMQDEYELRISRLQEELISLRSQVAANGANAGGGGTYSNEIPQPRY